MKKPGNCSLNLYSLQDLKEKLFTDVVSKVGWSETAVCTCTCELVGLLLFHPGLEHYLQGHWYIWHWILIYSTSREFDIEYLYIYWKILLLTAQWDIVNLFELIWIGICNGRGHASRRAITGVYYEQYAFRQWIISLRVWSFYWHFQGICQWPYLVS